MTAAYRHVRRHFDAIMGGDIEPIVKANFLTSTSLPSWLTWTNPNGHRTMFDSTGKLTWAPNNLFIKSNDFSDVVYWNNYKSGTGLDVVRTSGQEDPLGGTNGFRLQFDRGSSGFSYLYQYVDSLARNALYTVWLKSNTGSNQTIRRFDASGSGTSTWAVTPTWQQFSFKSAGPDRGFIFGISNAEAQTADILAYSAVMADVTYETSARTGDQQITTSAKYYGPRFDYNPATLAARGLLIEESRQNILTYSNTLNNAAWVDDASPITRSQNVTGPDGVSNSAWTLTDASAAAVGYIYQAANLTSGTTYTYSLFIKKTTGETVMPCISVSQSGASKRAGVNINTNTGAVTLWTSYTGETILASSSARVVEETTDYYRVALTFAAEGTASHVLVVVPANRTSLDAVGDGVASAQRSIVAYGAQLEASAFATSYIPTTTAAVTRNAEKVTSTTTAMGYVAATGTLVVEAELPTANQIAWIAGFDTTGGANAIALYKSASGDITTAGSEAAAYEAGATTLDLNGTLNSGDPFRVGLRYNTAGGASGFSASLNGGAIVSGTVRTPSPTAFGLGYRIGDAQWINGHIRSLAYYNKALPDATLQSKSTVGGSY